MKIATSYSHLPTTEAAIAEACARLRAKLADRSPELLGVHWSSSYQGSTIKSLLQREFPHSQIHGASSCRGVMTEAGVALEEGRGLGLLALCDSGGAYGVYGGELGDNPREEAGGVVLKAICEAGRPGEVPDMVRISTSPGQEDEVLAGIEDLLGPMVPVIGGSAADNLVAGDWELLSCQGHWQRGLVVSVYYPSTPISFAFHNGYSPTEHHGRVTKGSGRVVREIDHQPAAEVYNRWTRGLIAKALPRGGRILQETTLSPLGRPVDRIGKTFYYNLHHPEQVTADGGLCLFSPVNEGDELFLMRGTTETLISRAGRVAQSALKAGRFTPENISGALVVYCAGCMLTLQQRIDEVADSLNGALGGKPFLGSFTFGEQGCFIGGANRHANLMISVIIFGTTVKVQR